MTFRHRTLGVAAWVALTLVLASGCAVQVENRKPAGQLAAERDRPAGSEYLGWRVYQDKCARCHGEMATGGTAPGGAVAPNLLARMNDVGPRRFADLVLLRYDWDGADRRTRDDREAREALIDEIERRREKPQAMPAWQGEPSVNAHILDLYAYLAARSEGRLGPGRPAP